MPELIIAEREILLSAIAGEQKGRKIFDDMCIANHEFYKDNEKYYKIASIQLELEIKNLEDKLEETLLAEGIRIEEFTNILANKFKDPQENYDFLIKNSSLMKKKELLKEIGIKIARDEIEDDDIDKFENKFSSIKSIQKRKNLPEIYKDFNEEYNLYISGRLKVIKTDILPLDSKVIGLRPEDIWVLGAKSGAGKTHGLVQLALSFLEQGKKVLFITNEMSEMEILIRFGSHKSKVFEGAINDLEAYKDKREALKEGIDTFVNEYSDSLEIIRQINFDKALKIMQLTARTHSADVVILDYIQNFATDQNFFDERAQIAHICTNLIDFSKSYRVPVIVSSQVTDGQHLFKGAQNIMNMATVALLIRRGEVKWGNSDNPDTTVLDKATLRPTEHYKAVWEIIKSRRGGVDNIYGYYAPPDPMFHGIERPRDGNTTDKYRALFYNYKKN